jgi:S-adenosylmethionine synthetase
VGSSWRREHSQGKIGQKSTNLERLFAGRCIAKSLVAAGLAERILVQLSYAIGLADPLSIFVDSYGTAKQGCSDEDITKVILKNWDLRPGVIVKELGLQKAIIYGPTACYGHFGNSDYPWEQPKQLNIQL